LHAPPPELGVLARALADQAARQGRSVLLEHEVGHLLHAAGFDVPFSLVVGGPGDVPDLDDFPGGALVVKLLSARVMHRTEVHGVRVVAKEPHQVIRTVEEMLATADDPDAQVLLQEHIPHADEPGAELLLSLRWSAEFGPVATLALGGVTADVWGTLCRPGTTMRAWSGLHTAAAIEAELAAQALGSLITGGLRGRPQRVGLAAVAAAVERILALAGAVLPVPFRELEVNPLVFRHGRPLCLDAVVRLAPAGTRDGGAGARAPRHEVMEALLRPSSLAVVGASSRAMNPGRVILRNVLAAGFPTDRIQVVKVGEATLDGCRCVPSLGALDPVDLLVVGVGATEVPGILETVTEGGLARSVLLISGGLGEGGHGRTQAARVAKLLERPDAPGVNGGNCLGIRSIPGRCDTLFIPPEKLGFPAAPPHPVAVVSQSGAFAIARCSALPWINPRYLITVGNQVDLTVGAWVEYLVADADVKVVACYVEGFRPGDGARFLAAARAHRRGGRTVILYRAGRTAEGAEAMASHTASVAGDYAVTRALAERAGVLVADSAQDFGDLLTVAVGLAGRTVAGARVGLLSNAGFECVAMADGLGTLEAARFGPRTTERISGLLAEARLDGIVAPRNPLDVTPILGDRGFVAAAEAVLDDADVDVGVVSCVPLTPALQTLARDRAATGTGEDVEGNDAVVAGLMRLWGRTHKAWVVSVDGGPRYDAMVGLLQGAGIPVVRNADLAVDLLGRYVAARLTGDLPEQASSVDQASSAERARHAGAALRQG
jgi:acyl-CoA synthetase (NDP forming)